MHGPLRSRGSLWDDDGGRVRDDPDVLVATRAAPRLAGDGMANRAARCLPVVRGSEWRPVAFADVFGLE